MDFEDWFQQNIYGKRTLESIGGLYEAMKLAWAESLQHKNDAEGKTVRIPTSEDEAALMILLGTQYLQQNAPHRLIDVA